MKRLIFSAIACLASLFILPSVGLAAPLLLVDNITSQCVNGATTITLTMNPLSFTYFNGLTSVQTSMSTVPWPSNTNPASFNVSAGPGSFQLLAFVQGNLQPVASSPIYSYTGTSCGSSSTKGMTWRFTASNATAGTIDVGCGYNECNPYVGDTMCQAALPVLCFNPMAAAGPDGLPLPANGIVNNSDQYHAWSGGIVATTPPVAGKSFATIGDANNYCKAVFGKDWRVAEFHDGWGWYFQAYGGVGQPSQRFWVDINDQRSTPAVQKGTCWAN